MNKKIVFLIIVLVIIILFVGYLLLPKNISTTSSCIKEDNCCLKSDDCKYAWFTGACYTPEYVTKLQNEAEAKGMNVGEAQPRENVTCTCESNKCITHG
jgi:uncharacterized protein YxeA